METEIEFLDVKLTGTNFEILKIENYQVLIALNRFFDLYYIVTGANSNLMDASDKELDLRGWESNNEDTIRLFLRGEHLKSCILSYNSVEDYILQIITFAFNLKGMRVTSKGDFLRKSKNLYYRDIKKLAIRHNIDEEILKIIVEYHNDDDVKEIRRISNELKHNNNIRFSGLPSFTNGIGINTLKFNSKWFDPKTEDLESVINLCVRVNKKIKLYVEQVYNKVAEKYNLDTIKYD
ncbi:hypothetical protein GKD08_04075 [Paeniclostridium sordellii]|uniref:hypothetical protein n=1 Tax=Clostridia TaxID=186801 RepID=UPI0012AFE574|nr:MULTISPECIES: hypothetical protein [Clostridia]MDU4415256.1 hypothetical protein [Paeniclostridium sordellii]MDU4477928.1 hypothetical protein [Clostridium sp.]MRZ27940.1 hypothetical protein [Paeniclostridium sordellii]